MNDEHGRLVMRPSEAAALLGLGRSTITTWTADPSLRPFFSPAGQGGDGHRRSLSEHDIRVLHFIGEAKRANVSAEEIRVSLEQMQQRDWQGLPDMPAGPPHMANVPVMPTAAAEAVVTGERKGMLREIVLLNTRIESLESENTTLATRLEEKYGEITDLVQKMTQAQTQLHFLQQTTVGAEEARSLIERVAKAETELAVLKTQASAMEHNTGRDEDAINARLMEALEARIELTRQLSEAETELRLYRQGRLKPDGQ